MKGNLFMLRKFNFSDKLNYEEKERKEKIIELYDNEKWELIINHINEIRKYSNSYPLITGSAFKLAQKIKDQLNIEVFPAITSYHTSLNQKANGAWAWSMWNEKLFDIGSAEKTKDLLLKRNNLMSYRTSGNDIEIGTK